VEEEKRRAGPRGPDVEVRVVKADPAFVETVEHSWQYGSA
jgi:hypothetical protein